MSKLVQLNRRQANNEELVPKTTEFTKFNAFAPTRGHSHLRVKAVEVLLSSQRVNVQCENIQNHLFVVTVVSKVSDIIFNI